MAISSSHRAGFSQRSDPGLDPPVKSTDGSERARRRTRIADRDRPIPIHSFQGPPPQDGCAQKNRRSSDGPSLLVDRERTQERHDCQRNQLEDGLDDGDRCCRRLCDLGVAFQHPDSSDVTTPKWHDVVDGGGGQLRKKAGLERRTLLQ
jgi:hypothetical protein